MPYPEEMIAPMRHEMAMMGFQPLRTADDVQAALSGDENQTVLLFVNSVCGCAGGIARPGLALALSNETLPSALGTTFAGNDVEATDYVRSLFSEYPPSSPQAALFKGGKPVEVFQRHQIEGADPMMFASLLTAAFDRHCR